MPRPRFTLRWLMVAVAVVGVMCTAGVILHRRNQYLARAANHASEQSRLLAVVARADKPAYRSLARREPLHTQLATLRKRAEFHGQLHRKYESAAFFPWLPVAPDPPEPE